MADDAEHKVEHGEKHGGGGGDDPMHHILDKVLVGVNAKTGQLTPGSEAYDEHGHAFATYEPQKAGPFKLEFTKHMLGFTVVAAILFALSMLVARRVLAGLRDNKAPAGPLANAIEAIIVYVRDEIVAPVGGHHLAHYTPLFITYFLFILIANLMGMIPEFGGVTGNISVTIALGGSIYALVWILGIANQGLLHYLKHLVPPGTPLGLWLPMFFLELAGPLIKCFVLCVRLFANMIAGHLIIGALLGLGAVSGLLMFISVPLALGVSLLEVMVCFIQAFVFTLLAVIFIGAAVHPEH